MEVLYSRVAGLDVHKKTVVACVLLNVEGVVRKQVRTFGTTTAQLQALCAWLRQASVTHIALESTGSYWKPVFNLLETDETFTPWLIHPAHIKQVPGRKTDVKDAEWIAELLHHGLLQPSYVPERTQCELRELTRYRTSIIEERAREIHRIQKILEGANIKLSSVISNVLGVSGRRMLDALAAGETDAAQLASLADDRLRATPEALQEALTGLMASHQRFLLTEQLQHLRSLDATLERLDQEVAKRLADFHEALTLLQTIPGVGRRAAEVSLAQVGSTAEAFPSAPALAKWTGLVPGNKESAGKRLSGRTTPGNSALRSVLVEAAHAAGRTRSTYLGAQYRRAARLKGRKRAAVMVAHSLIVIIWHVLRHRTPYVDLGVDYFDRRDQERAKQQAVKRLEGLGYHVKWSQAPA